MLLPRIRRVFPLRQWCRRRTFADAVPKYSPKVRALPFSISQEAAVANMAFHANVTFLSNLNLKGIWQALWSQLSDLKFVQPNHVQAVYLPAWIVDAEVETSVWPGNSARQLATVQLVDSSAFKYYYSAPTTLMPGEGYSFDFLSRISLNNDEIAASDAVPFSEDLTTQHGSQVLCLPYNISPLSLVNKLRSMPNRVAVTDDLRFDPAININFLAAYPILIPLYLAQYDKDDVSTTIVLEAFAPSGRIYFERFEPSRWFSQFVNYVHGTYWQAQGAATPFSKVSMPSRKYSGALHQWLDQMIIQPGGPELLVSNTSIDFEDRRVREFTEDETVKNRAFLNVSNKMAKMKHMLKELTDEDSEPSDNRTVAIKIGLSGISTVGGNDFASAIKSEIDDMRKMRDGMMPQWWKDGVSKSP